MANEKEPLLGSTEFRPTMDPNSLEIINPEDGTRIGNLLWNDNGQFRVEFSTPDPTLALPFVRLADIVNRGYVVLNGLRTKKTDKHP